MFQEAIDAWNSIPDMGAFLSASAMVIFNLILIEGLLSVDNALGIAAMAARLPKEQQKPALRWGLVGAYVFRGIALALVAWLMHNLWVKWFGALYLIYLACLHVQAGAGEEKTDTSVQPVRRGKTFLLTIVSIELMDLSLSLDNVVAAVGMVNNVTQIPEALHIWVVCIGVFIGIAALRLVAGWCIGIIEKHPILNYTAFLLVGFVGAMLCAELTLDCFDIQYHLGIGFKFGMICGIVVASLVYERYPAVHRALAPFVRVFRRACAIVVDVVMFAVRRSRRFPRFSMLRRRKKNKDQDLNP
ncbi:MAG: hypothetical protein MJ058_06465 [Akkermansia sp.]|nr:hypothetical protein [Akkermansia sp.]